MKQGKTDIVELAKAIQHEADNKKDYVSPSQLMSIEANGSLKVSMQDADGGKMDMPLSQHASRQLGTKFGIPAKYFDKMLKNPPWEIMNLVQYFETSDRRVGTLVQDAAESTMENYESCAVF